MKILSKKSLSLLLLIAVLISLVGCSSDEKNEEETQSEQTSSVNSTQSETNSTSEELPNEDNIKVNENLTLTYTELNDKYISPIIFALAQSWDENDADTFFQKDHHNFVIATIEMLYYNQYEEFLGSDGFVELDEAVKFTTQYFDISEDLVRDIYTNSYNYDEENSLVPLADGLGSVIQTEVVSAAVSKDEANTIIVVYKYGVPSYNEDTKTHELVEFTTHTTTLKINEDGSPFYISNQINEK